MKLVKASQVSPTRRRWSFTALLLLAPFLWYFALLPLYGIGRAAFDFAIGQPHYRTYGHIRPEDGEVAALLKRRHNISVECVGTCTVSPFAIRTADAYNWYINLRMGCPTSGGRSSIYAKTAHEIPRPSLPDWNDPVRVKARASR